LERHIHLKNTPWVINVIAGKKVNLLNPGSTIGAAGSGLVKEN
jgi:hypothetical protein